MSYTAQITYIQLVTGFERGQAWSRMATAHGAGLASIRQALVWLRRSTAPGAVQASIRRDRAWLLRSTAPGAMLGSTRQGLVWLVSSTAHGVYPESTRLGQVSLAIEQLMFCKCWFVLWYDLGWIQWRFDLIHVVDLAFFCLCWVYAGATSAGICTLCQAGTYQTGSGDSCPYRV